MEFKHFKHVLFYNDPNDGVAKSHAGRGELLINLAKWHQIPEAHKKFILCHEEAHIVLNTRNELLADEYASKKYLAHGNSLTQSVKALTSILNSKSREHTLRAWLQYQRALQHDWQHNKNPKAYRPHYDTVSQLKNNKAMQANILNQIPGGGGHVFKHIMSPGTIAGNYTGSKPVTMVPAHPVALQATEMPDIPATTTVPALADNLEYTNFLGIAIGKKARRRKQEKFNARMENKRARAANKRSKAEARVILANQGIAVKSDFAEAVSGLGKAGGAVLAALTGGGSGAGSSIPEMPTYNPVPYTEPQYQNTLGNAMQSVAAMAPMEQQYQAASMAAPMELPPQPEAKKNNTALIIGGAVALLVVVLLVAKKK